MANEGPQKSLRLNVVVSSGTGIGTFTNEWVNCRWIRIRPVNETDTFNVAVADADGILMFVRTGQLGTMSEKLEMSLGIMRTITITSATNDGTYVVKLDVH